MEIIEHRGRAVAISSELSGDMLDRVKAEAIKKIDYELNERPKVRAKIEKTKELLAELEVAKARAMDNLRFHANPELLALTDEFGLTELIIENTSLDNHPLSMAAPQLNALKVDMTLAREALDKDFLQDYWSAQENLLNRRFI